MSKTVLVVDDFTSFQSLVRLAPQEAGYAVIDAVDGRDALIKLAQEINLVVCDVNMPHMHRLTFVRHLNAQPAYKFAPVIMLTTESQEAKKAEGRAAGVRAWVPEPFQPSQLVDPVTKLCV